MQKVEEDDLMKKRRLSSNEYHTRQEKR